MRLHESRFEARVRFNWGYHAAQGPAVISVHKLNDTVRNREWALNHFDKAYGISRGIGR